MGFIQEKIIHLRIGVSRAYELLQFSDVHVATFQASDSEEAKEKAVRQEALWRKQRVDFARKFGETYDSERLLSSTECLERLIDHANDRRPDAVLLTGDLIDYPSEANQAFLERSLRRIASPYLFSCGNHDSDSPLFPEPRKRDFDSLDFGDFFLVSLDDSKRTFSRFQGEALEKLLTFRKPILLSMHVPLVTECNEAKFASLDSYYTVKYTDCDETTGRFLRLVQTSDEVKALFCGHTHGAIVSSIAPNKPQFCCSSGLIGSVNRILIE